MCGTLIQVDFSLTNESLIKLEGRGIPVADQPATL